MCDCATCVRHRKWTADLNPQTPEALAAWEEVQVTLALAEDDAEYWKAKYEGRWPDRAAAFENTTKRGETESQHG